ncbi:MAG: hypothetical protein LW717_05890 [Chloroflexaceae bacterium]|jgi:hypothetical protein|nr:hypothetical protein [Chloroflexaceae bacterium]
MPISPDGFQYLQKHIPTTSHRIPLLRMLQASIATATQVAPARWSLTCNRDVVRLNVGMIEVLVVTTHEINIVVDYTAFSAITATTALTFDYEYISPESAGDGVYKSVPGSAAIFVAPAAAAAAMQQIRPAHSALMRNAAHTKLNPAVAKAHQAAVAQWLNTGAW